jgi:hypothetical protein
MITALLWASSAACSSGHEYDSAVAEMDRDLKAVTDAMSDVTEVVEIRRVPECRNDGSGPIPPGSLVDLVLRGEHTLDDATRSATSALASLGYEVRPGPGGSSPITVEGRRTLEGRWDATIRVIDDDTQGYDLRVGNDLVPRIVC